MTGFFCVLFNSDLQLSITYANEFLFPILKTPLASVSESPLILLLSPAMLTLLAFSLCSS